MHKTPSPLKPIPQTDIRRRPWTVLVVRNLVVKVYSWIIFADESAEMEDDCRQIAECTGLPVLVYEVDARLPPPPSPGTPADPVALGWFLADTVQARSARAS